MSNPAAGILIYSADTANNGFVLFDYGTVGDLFTVTFAVAGNAPAGAWPINLMAVDGTTTTAMFGNPPGSADWLIFPEPTNASDGIDGLVTIDATPPSVAVNIVDESLCDADNSSLVTFTFSESVTGFTLADLSAVGGTLSAFSGSGASYSATFTATDGIEATGSVAVAAGSYTDAAGNLGTGGSDTVVIDTRNPTVAWLSPEDGSNGVGVNENLVITFGEAIRKGAGTIVIRHSSDDSVVEAIDVSNAAVSVSGATVTMDPAAPLAASTRFYVEVSAGALEDLAGNGFAGIAGATAWNFRTGLVVTRLTPTSTGFHVQFSQDVDASVLNLYDQDETLGPADVLLAGQTAGTVRGSLVIGPGPNQATFVATAGLLAADQYTVTLKSGTAAFRDPAGNLLDGDGDGTPGDDYAGSFAVSAPVAGAVTVSLPNFARGYGQSVQLPADEPAAGLPLAISRGLGVTRVELSVHYDPSLLAISAFSLNSAVQLCGGQSVLNTSTLGVAVLTITAATGLAEAAGPLTLGTFTAAVPNDARYAGKHILDIRNLRVYDDAAVPAELPALDGDAIHVAAYFGDSDGNLGYNSPDATLVRRIIGQFNSGLSAYQMVDPRLIVDITRNGLIQSNDTTQIRRAIGLVAVPNIPELPEGLSVPAASGADPRIYIPRDLVAAPGQTVTVPVMIDVTDPAGVTIGGFDLVLEYDATRFVVTQAALGSLLQGTDLAGRMAEPAPGKLILSADSLAGTSRFPTGTVDALMTLTVEVLAGASPGTATWNLLANMGRSRTAVYDAGLRELVLDPPPTNGARDSGDGRLRIDRASPPRRNAADVNADGLVTALKALVLADDVSAPADGASRAEPLMLRTRYGGVHGNSLRTPPQDVLTAGNRSTASGRSAAASALLAAGDLEASLFRGLARDRSPLEGVLNDLAADVASAWR